MSDLVEFYNARLDEAAGGHTETAHGCMQCGDDWPCLPMRKIEAKRRVVDLHGFEPHECPVWDEPLGVTCTSYELDCRTLRLLVLPYADHPDYLEEWRPETS